MYDSKSMWVVYYDGHCGFCGGMVRGLARLDYWNAVTWTPWQSLNQPPSGLSWDDLQSAVYLDTGSGNLKQGFFAFRWLTLRLLPLIPLAPLFWIPGVQLLGAPLYRWVARHRYCIAGRRPPNIPS